MHHTVPQQPEQPVVPFTYWTYLKRSNKKLAQASDSLLMGVAAATPFFARASESLNGSILAGIFMGSLLLLNLIGMHTELKNDQHADPSAERPNNYYLRCPIADETLYAIGHLILTGLYVGAIAWNRNSQTVTSLAARTEALLCLFALLTPYIFQKFVYSKIRYRHKLHLAENAPGDEPAAAGRTAIDGLIAQTNPIHGHGLGVTHHAQVRSDDDIDDIIAEIDQLSHSLKTAGLDREKKFVLSKKMNALTRQMMENTQPQPRTIPHPPHVDVIAKPVGNYPKRQHTRPIPAQPRGHHGSIKTPH